MHAPQRRRLPLQQHWSEQEWGINSLSLPPLKQHLLARRTPAASDYSPAALRAARWPNPASASFAAHISSLCLQWRAVASMAKLVREVGRGSLALSAVSLLAAPAPLCMLCIALMLLWMQPPLTLASAPVPRLTAGPGQPLTSAAAAAAAAGPGGCGTGGRCQHQSSLPHPSAAGAAALLPPPAGASARGALVSVHVRVNLVRRSGRARSQTPQRAGLCRPACSTPAAGAPPACAASTAPGGPAPAVSSCTTEEGTHAGASAWRRCRGHECNVSHAGPG